MIRFVAGQTRANNVVIRLATNGAGTFLLAEDLAAGNVDVIVDVVGYFD